MSQLKNKMLTYLLSDTEEGVREPKKAPTLATAESMGFIEFGAIKAWEVGALTYNEMREATRDSLSVTDDMRRMSVQRLINEIQRKIMDVAQGYPSYMFQRGFDQRINEILHEYIQRGAIEDARVEVVHDSIRDTIDFHIEFKPPLKIETINMNVSLSI